MYKAATFRKDGSFLVAPKYKRFKNKALSASTYKPGLLLLSKKDCKFVGKISVMETQLLINKINKLPQIAQNELFGYVDYLVFKYNFRHKSNYQITDNQESDKTESEKLFFSLAGSWQSDESGEELVKFIYDSRYDSFRKVDL